MFIHHETLERSAYNEGTAVFKVISQVIGNLLHLIKQLKKFPWLTKNTKVVEKNHTKQTQRSCYRQKKCHSIYYIHFHLKKNAQS